MNIPGNPHPNTFVKNLRRSALVYGLYALAILSLSGCGDFFAKKPTEIETREILNELSQIRENPNITNTLPDLYRTPPKRVATKEGVKLFYFTKHHSADNLAKLVKDQFCTKPVGDAGKRTAIPGYDVSASPATNQLIYHCPNDAEIDKALNFLENIDVPPIQVNIDCLILERFGDVTMDYETSIMIENFLGQEITIGEARGEFTSGVLDELAPAFPGASLREETRSTFGLDFGYWIDKGVPGHQVRAVIDMLISRGYLKILLNPTLETVNGKEATVTIRDFAPYEKIVTGQAGPDAAYNLTDYKWVEDTLTVTPSVFSDGSIGLKTSITIGSKSKPEGVVQASIITERSIKVAENRIPPGQSLVIGGMRKSEKRSVIRGVPFFKDLPIIGALFSSKDFEEKATEIIFILTPSISSGGREYAEMAEFVRQKHASPEVKGGIEGVLDDPFGTEAYTEHVEEKASKAELERFKADLEKAEAQEELGKMKEMLIDKAYEVFEEKRKAESAGKEARLAQEAAQKAREEAQKARQEQEKTRAEAEKVRADAEKARTEAQKAKQQYEQATQEAKKTLEESEKKNKF